MVKDYLKRLEECEDWDFECYARVTKEFDEDYSNISFVQLHMMQIAKYHQTTTSMMVISAFLITVAAGLFYFILKKQKPKKEIKQHLITVDPEIEQITTYDLKEVI